MKTAIFNLDDGGSVYYDDGWFDPYCVFIERPNQKRYAPKDKDYFIWIKRLAKKYGGLKVWYDFNRIYDIVDMNGQLDQEKAMLVVYNIDKYYNEETITWWIVYYLTMLAECRKEGAKLKKRIKKLGVYNILFDGYDIDYVTTYMKNTTGQNDWWKELDKLMKERGI